MHNESKRAKSGRVLLFVYFLCFTRMSDTNGSQEIHLTIFLSPLCRHIPRAMDSEREESQQQKQLNLDTTWVDLVGALMALRLR